MKKPNYVVLFVLVLICVYLLISVSAYAEALEVKNQQINLYLIEKLDLDKDGQITIKEAVAAPSILAAFGKIDTNGNGKISPFELSQISDPQTPQLKSTQLD